MKPGVPFDVLLNKDSKRKIQSSVGWKGHDRLFGSDAFNIVSSLSISWVDTGLSHVQNCRLQDSPATPSHI